MSPLYFVMFAALVVWLGLFAYLWRLDARVREIERLLPENREAASIDAPEAVLEPRTGGRA